MKSYRELMGEMVVMDLPKARKNKMFKKEGEEKKTTYYRGDTILQTLEAAMKKLRIKA